VYLLQSDSAREARCRWTKIENIPRKMQMYFQPNGSVQLIKSSAEMVTCVLDWRSKVYSHLDCPWSKFRSKHRGSTKTRPRRRNA
jgi:hypothetical protein